MRRSLGVGMVVLLAVSAIGAAAAPTTSPSAPVSAGISTEQLIYKGATVEVQVDVNGVAAVQLLGDALDALAAQAKEQAQAIAQSGAGGQQAAVMISAGLPLIDPAKEALKSLTRAAVVVMKPAGKTSGEAVSGYYSQLMSGQGWSSLLTVKGPQGENVSVMIAPEAKGLFLMVQAQDELVVGMVTTSQPIGQLIGQIVRASGGVVPAIIAGRSGSPAPAIAEESQAAPEAQPE